MATRVTGLISGMDTESLVSAMVSNYTAKVEKYTKAQTKLSWTQDAWKSLNTKVYSLYTNISNLRFSSGYSLQKATVSDTTKASATANGSAVVGTQKLNVLSMAQTAYMTSADLSKKYSGTIDTSTKLSNLGYEVTDENGNPVATKLNITTKDENGNDVTTQLSLSGESTISDVLAGLKEAGLNASFDKSNNRFYINAKSAGESGDFSITADTSDENSAAMLSALGMNTQEDDSEGTDSTNYATKIDGIDAKIRLNGVLYTGSSNTFTVNGLTINATGITGDGDENAITVTTETDTQGLYDKIKDFLTEYNNVINEMTKLYNADSASGYEPLTDDEKAAMSETEIEKWETKIKDSLLRRDTTLNGVMQSMMSAMSNTITVNGTKLSLSSFGIHTLGFLNAPENEQNAFHIDGDEDDENTSGNTDKLMEALNTNPEQVIDFMKQLTSNLYSSIGDKMTATSLSSAYTIYNDKQMTTQYSEYTSLIDEWEDKLADKEDFYYSKFATMETKLSELQSQTSSLSGLLGSS
ncbi:MAG: hypothetical protein E7282_05870 [Lachnospiraceae bacterium]|jgi:flagellar hook-associated protein 2|nr:hypothetical protein [Lachnospiraceae bacterium]